MLRVAIVGTAKLLCLTSVIDNRVRRKKTESNERGAYEREEPKKNLKEGMCQRALTVIPRGVGRLGRSR